MLLNTSKVQENPAFNIEISVHYFTKIISITKLKRSISLSSLFTTKSPTLLTPKVSLNYYDKGSKSLKTFHPFLFLNVRKSKQHLRESKTNIVVC